MILYRIMRGNFTGRIGTIDKTIPGWKMFHNVMFYPIDDISPYRICKNIEDLMIIDYRKEE